MLIWVEGRLLAICRFEVLLCLTCSPQNIVIAGGYITIGLLESVVGLARDESSGADELPQG